MGIPRGGLTRGSLALRDALRDQAVKRERDGTFTTGPAKGRAQILTRCPVRGRGCWWSTPAGCETVVRAAAADAPVQDVVSATPLQGSLSRGVPVGRDARAVLRGVGLRAASSGLG